MNQYLKKIKNKNKYREFLKVLNGLLQLSDREIDILSLLLQLDLQWPKDLGNKNVISTDSRKFIMDTATVNKSNLSKYLNKFITYGILVDTGLGYSVKDVFKPIINNDKIEVTFILDLKN